MTTSFGATPQRSGRWAWFKPLLASKSLVIQYDDDADNSYLIFGYDPPEVCTCTIWKGAVPPAVIAQGYSQAQNDADKVDFEANFKPYANRSIDDIPSKIIASAIKNGGSANLAVDGSVTPVVFEYNPPSNYEIEVNQIVFLFEDATAVQMGNKFIFNALGTLANGLLLECKAADLSFTWQNMKRTRDLVEIAEAGGIDVFSGTTNLFRAVLHLPRSLRLARDGTHAQPDYLRVTVRDNLTALDFAEAFFQGVKV